MPCNSIITDVCGRDLLFSHDFKATEFAARRRTIAGTLGAKAHLLVAGAPPVPGDVPVQDANFYYFCGLETCHSYLLIDGKDGHTTLFLPSRDTMDGEIEDKLGFEVSYMRKYLGDDLDNKGELR